MEEKKLMRDLLEEENFYSSNLSFEFLRDKELVNYKKCTYYIYMKHLMEII